MSSSLPLSRRDVIESRLAEGREIVAAALAAEFNVSEDAVRRDLRALAAEGKCRRVYGGALPLLTLSQPISARIGQASDRKRVLARVAVGMIQPGEFLFFDSGSTNLAMVELLPKNSEVTIATNSIDIASAVMKRGDIPLVLIGGAVDPVVGGSVDAGAVAAIETMNIDRCFVGVCAISARNGISVYEHADAIFKRTLLKRSALRIAMITSEKFHERAPHRIGGAADIDWLIVENDLPAEDEEAALAAGFTLLKPDGVASSS
ncbi:DeoR/GlpR family DNA-binding transcription regulator [Rhizobium sp. BK602]|uniref:DeoR/GlpR family DNA-binding transcription regulator n=1 Tax=Rhizobium sp. BK602 TaxID=2586986 RepID=UPI00161BE12B|nr:DeoR/GlpR family DNA-binding transcription regulator [Rhizobium sp. BK602]